MSYGPTRLSFLALLLAGLALGSSTSCKDAPPGDPYVAAEGRLHDARGRELLLHGVNARIQGLFDVSFDDGRTTLEPIPPFTEEDCRFLGEDMGLNHLRLLVNWSAIEPQDDAFDEAYLAHVLEVAAFCEKHGVLSVVDLHQDAFSKEIGEDGAPLWAIQPPPTELLQGPLDDLGDRRASQQVADAFDALYSNRYGTLDEYAEMAGWLAGRIDGKPGVVGLDLHNEPMNYIDYLALDDFHRVVTAAVRAAAPNMTVFFEPSALRNITDNDPAEPPFLVRDAVYSPHVYSDVFENGWASEDVALVQNSVAGTRAEATKHGAALYVGEFGHDDSARGALYVQTAMDAFDTQLASWAYWVYEEWSQGGWGLYDASGDPIGREGLRPARADLLARAYPVAIAGHVESFGYDGGTRTLTVQISSTFAADHLLAAPMRTYPGGVVATCDGAPVAVEHAAGRARLRCRGSTITLAPAP